MLCINFLVSYVLIYFLMRFNVRLSKTLPKQNVVQKQPPEVFCKKGVVRHFAKFI